MQKINFFLAIFLMMFAAPTLFSQVVISDDGSGTADATAVLDVQSTQKGVLLPRMTENQIKAIPTPADGLMVYNISNQKLIIFNGTDGFWYEISGITQSFEPNEGSFTCGDLLTDDRDGQTYTTVEIEGKCWMAENLNIGNFITAQGQVIQDPDNGQIDKFCQSDNSSDCDEWGGYYQFAELMQGEPEGGQGICPPGWHIPTEAEFQALIDFFSDATEANIKLKETGTDHWGGSNGTNTSGFTAFGGGYSHGWGWQQINGIGFFLSSTTNKYLQIADYVGTDASIGTNSNSITNAGSVRCLKN